MINRFSITATIVIVLIAVVTIMILKNQSPLINPSYERLTPTAQKQVQCLAKNIYFEARNESVEGQKAVAFVTLNRVKSGDFPDTICDVVEQKKRVAEIGDRKVVCQFSWYCEKVPKFIYTNELLTKRDDPLYNEIRDLATYVYANYERLPDPTKGSLFYHADYVRPGWKNMVKVTKIGTHIFYTKRNDT
jgi:spore germination cell wall hydrolase CwlJ-like protein